MELFIPKDRKSLFRQFLAGMYDAVVITDPNGHILEINPRTVEYFGREVDEALDQPISIFILAPGAFLVYAFIIAIQNKLKVPRKGCLGDCGSCPGHEIVNGKEVTQ